MRILVIDDDPLAKATLGRILAGRFETESAADGVEGMKLFHAFCPDVVFTGLYMPEKDGLETIREIRAVTRDVFIVAMNRAAREGLVDFLDAARALGANATLRKPFRANEVEDLLGRVRRHALA